MSDPPAPKPKPGSLRDRIAAFENKGGGAAPAPAPATRPKPGGVAWKPRPASPPPSAPAQPASPGGPSEHAPGAQRPGGMNASDAKESIGAGLSLKERMAALKGKGAFNAPAGAPAPAPPRPAGDKPKWKPSLPVASPPPAQADEAAKEPNAEAKSPPADVKSPTSEPVAEASQPLQSPSAGEDQPKAEEIHVEGEPAEEDPEEEERKRRAAIAARMARLGGARVGMAPPIFGKKPEAKRRDSAQEESQPTVTSPPPKADAPKEAKELTPQAPSEPKPEEVEPTGGQPAEDDARAAKESTAPTHIDLPKPAVSDRPTNDALSPESAESKPRTPLAMPVPTAPRRAAPPRKKASAKSPSPAPTPTIADVGAEPKPEAPAQDEVSEPASTKDAQSTPLPEEVKPEIDAQETDPQGAHIEPSPTAKPPFDEDMPSEAKPTSTTESAKASPLPVSAPETPADAPILPGASHPDEVTEGLSHTPEADKPASHTDADAEQNLTAAPSDATLISEHEPAPPPTSPPTTSARERLVSPPSSPPATTAPPAAFLPAVVSPKDEATGGSEPLAEEEDEEARRRRIAERMAKMGGLNPFGGPPRAAPERKGSASSMGELAVQSLSLSKPTVSADLQGATPVIPQLRSSPKSSGEDWGKVHDPEEEEASEAKHELGESEDAEVPLVPQQEGSSLNYKTVVIDAHDKQEHREVTVLEDPALTEDATTTLMALSSPPPVSAIEAEDVEESAPAPPLRRSMPPPPRQIPTALEVEDEEEPTLTSPPPPPTRPSIPLPPPVAVSEEQEEEAAPANRPPVLSPTRPDVHEKDKTAPPPISAERPIAASSPVQLQTDQDFDEEEDTVDPEDGDEEDMLPPSLPSGRHSVPPAIPGGRPNIPAATPPTNIEEEHHVEAPPTRPERPAPPIVQVQVEADDHDDHDDLSPRNETPTMITPEARRSLMDIPLVSPQPPQVERLDTRNLEGHHVQELMDDDEGDPIDPRFHSPVKLSPAATPALPQAPVAPTESEEDGEQARRRTIAERMAKLGGIKFGAPPPVRPRPPPDAPSAPGEGGDPSHESPAPAPAVAPEAPATEEEEEQARKERIRAKLAGMGGMRFGMIPPTAAPSAHAPARKPSQDEHAHVPTSPSPVPSGRPSKPVTAPSPAPVSSLDDEPEDIGAEVEEAQEEVPPPPPARASRPPVPVGLPIRRGSAQTTSSVETATIPRPPLKTADSEFVEVEEPEESEPEYIEAEDAPPPPPPRLSRPPPSRAAPVPPPPPPEDSEPEHIEAEDEAPPPPPPRFSRPPPTRAMPAPPTPSTLDTAGNQWQLPSIPTGGLDLSASGEIGTDLASSVWSEDSTSYPPAPPSKAALHREDPTPLPSAVEKPMSADDLMSVWGRVGVIVVGAAADLQQRAQKSIVGDGSYGGFVSAVLSEVPNAMAPVGNPPSYGHLVYLQSGASVQRRASEIMPGDVIALYDAKLKGHKGIQSYNQHAGAEEPCVGIVSEFEPKKSKVRVLQANQHVGQQAVESVSYRLEDLKSGTVKVFRVLEA